MKSEKALTEINKVPHLLSNNDIQMVFHENNQLVIFLDFDGTLSSIVNRPEDAVLFPGMKEVMEKCASRYTVAVVSGRDTDNVRSRVGIEGIIYAGSHGFSIKGPNDLLMEHEEASRILPLLAGIENKLRELFSNGPAGIQIERKKYAITVHFRNADPSLTGKIKEMTDNVISEFSGIKKERGKMIIEIKPDVDWNKGMAVRWILEKLDLWNHDGVFPVYLGDDITDEDAFRMLHGRGLGIIVGSHDNPTAADFRLENVVEVKQFLEMLSDLPEKEHNKSEVNLIK